MVISKLNDSINYIETRALDKDDVDLLQLRADFRAWMDIVTAVDKRMGNYEMQIKMVLEQTEKQMTQGGSY